MPSPDPDKPSESRLREIGLALEFWVLAAVVAGAPIYGIAVAILGVFRK